MTSVKRFGRGLFERVESGFDAVFTPAWNPFYHLGALGWFYYWIVAASGFYVYIFYDSGVEEAYASVEYMTHVQWYAAGVMRSLHRYASDALIIVMLIHLLREFAMDRFRGPRWFAWLTGVPILWLVYASGISGYWVVWDQLAQYVAILTSEWLDTLPFFGEPIARNFIHDSTLSGRFFTLMVFIHIAVPLILLFIMWVHIQRHAYSKVNPPRGLAIGSLASLVVLSFVYPALSQGPADLGEVPSVVGLDWFYLTLYPLLDVVRGELLWLLLGVATLILLALPWLPPKPREPVAVVDLDNCNGCGRCVADCPFTALTMKPRTDGKAFAQEVVVDAGKCVACGICAGSCPTATPYRRRSELVPGIDLPRLPVAEIRRRTLEAAASLEGDARVIVYGCEAGPSLDGLAGASVATLRLACIGQLPPAFVDFVLSRRHADGVLLTGCRDGDCHYRLGIRWTQERLDGERDPRLRARVPRERVATCWRGLDREGDVHEALVRLRRTLSASGSESENAAPMRRAEAQQTSATPEPHRG